jgi:hypothetical protein
LIAESLSLDDRHGTVIGVQVSHGDVITDSSVH